MLDIILIVALIVVGFVIALMNNKKRRETTSEKIRIVRGSMDAFDEEAWTWPEDAGEVIELHPLDTFLDGTIQLTMIKPHTLKLTSAKPFLIEGRPTRAFELANYENLVLIPVDDEDAEPIILSYEKMFNINAPVEDRKVIVARQLKELRDEGRRARGEIEQDIEQDKSMAAAELAAAGEQLDELTDQAEDALENLGDAIEDKVDGLKDKIEARFDGLEDRLDDLKDRIEDALDGDDDEAANAK